jgi:DNA primase
MAGRIPQEFIDELTARLDIVEVIDSHVALRKAGREYVARCPFHDEKTPSFTVSPDKQFYHCFGCGAHGTVIGFMMEYNHLDFVDAIHELAARAGLKVPRSDDGPARKAAGTDLYEVLREAAAWFRRQLRDHPRGAAAIDYLKGRGLDGETAAAYGLGYAPPGWDGLLKALVGRYGEDRLTHAGLIIRKDQGGHYDRFRDRIMFPIRDSRGRVIAFGGRVLGDDSPKYLNSPETDVFHKGRELYGLYEARSALRDLDRLLVVEGYMDAVMLARHGIRYAVATLGTATTPQHLERMFRVTPEVVFCFDGDRAGRHAAWRALENALPAIREGRQARFMFLPEGEDPDTLVRKEQRERFEERLVKAVTLSAYFYDTLTQRADTATIDGRARLVELARPYLSKISPGVFRHMMVDQLAKLSRIDAVALGAMLSGGQPVPVAVRRTTQVRPGGRLAGSLVRRAIALLLRKPALAQQQEHYRRLGDAAIPGISLLVEMLDLLRNNPHYSAGSILEHWRDHDYGRYLARLAREEALIPTERLDGEFADAMRRLNQRYLEQQIARLRAKPWEALSQADKDQLKQLLVEKSAGGAGSEVR